MARMKLASQVSIVYYFVLLRDGKNIESSTERVADVPCS